MSEFRIEYVDPNNSQNTIVYELSATTEISVSESASVTKYPVEDGSTVIDNFVVDNRTISFSGIITDVGVSNTDDSLSVSDWIEGVRELRRNKTLFNTHVHSLDIIPNCIITDFTLRKDKRHGLSGWDVNLTIVEIDISERAKLTTKRVAIPEVALEVAKKTNNGDSPTKGADLSLSPLAKLVDPDTKAITQTPSP